MARRLCIACLIVLTTPVIAQCSPGKAEQATTIAHQRQAELLRYRTDGMTTVVPAAVSVQIAHLKDALAVTADAAMSCASPAEAPTSIQSRLAKLFGANQPEKSFSEPTGKRVDDVYGADFKIAVSTPANAPQLRAIELSFDIECGNDTELLIYEAAPEGWHQLLRWQSREYKEISGAFGDFFTYAVIPSTTTMNLRVAVAHGTPWCTSRFSSFAIDVLGQSDIGRTPRIVWHTRRDYSRGDFVNRLRATDDGFELRVNAATLDVSTSYERTVIYKYQVAGDVVRRVPPIATNGRGFVEEWMDMPWNEAKGQIVLDAVTGLQLIHDRLEKSQKDSKTYITYTYGPVRSCQTKARYEVQMNADPGGPQFYTIEERPTGYIMVNYSTAPDEHCSGPDLMKKP